MKYMSPVTSHQSPVKGFLFLFTCVLVSLCSCVLVFGQDAGDELLQEGERPDTGVYVNKGWEVVGVEAFE